MPMVAQIEPHLKGRQPNTDRARGHSLTAAHPPSPACRSPRAHRPGVFSESKMMMLAGALRIGVGHGLPTPSESGYKSAMDQSAKPSPGPGKTPREPDAPSFGQSTPSSPGAA